MHNFTERFYNLYGSTSGHTKRNFNKFLQEISSLQQNELTDLIEQIVPRNLQEKLFHLQILLKFGNYKALERTLFQCNKYVNKKLATNLHFIKHLSHIPATEFCQRICPEISYVSRIHIINRLADVITDTKLGESYFVAIHERYGIRTASKLLLACSEEFILKAVNKYELKLNDNQLIFVYNKYPTLLHVYFNNERNFKNHNKFAQYLALKDTKTFCKLIKQGIPTKIGRKASIKFLKEHKSDVLANPNFYKDIIKARIANSVFDYEECMIYFAKLLPDNVDEYSLTQDQYKYLKAMPLKVRGDVLFTTFRNHFGQELDNDFVDESTLELLIPEERKKFILHQRYLQFMPSEEAIPLIKNKICLTKDVEERKALHTKLIEVCKHNRDYDALVNVLEYFVEQHKNYASGIIQSFLETLNELFKLDKLSQQHWHYIDNILTTIEINDDDWYWLANIIELKIRYKYFNSLNYTDDIPMYLKHRKYYNFTVNIPVEGRRECVLKSAECIYQFESNEHSEAVNAFFESLFVHNRMKNSKPISIFDYKKYFHLIFVDFRRYVDWLGGDLIYLTTVSRNDEEEDLLLGLIREYFDVGSSTSRDYINLWFLRNKPEIVIEYAVIYFTNYRLSMSNAFYYEASKSPSVAKRFKEAATNIINSAASDSTHIVNAFKYLVFENDFLEIVSNFQPSGDYNININDRDIKDKLIILKGLLKVIHNVAISDPYIPKILNYCKGDYFVHAIKALRSTLYNIPEKSIYSPIDKLMQDQVSIKADAICLAAYFGTSRYFREILLKLSETESSQSVRKIIFIHTFKRFLHYPEDSFNLLQKHIELLDRNDEESFKMLLELHKIPKFYQAAYVGIIWEHIKAQHLQYKLMDTMQIELWNNLKLELCESIIKNTLFNNGNVCTIQDYVYEYLLRGGNLNTIYDSCAKESQIFELLQELMNKVVKDNKRSEFGHQLIMKLLENIHYIPVKHNKYPFQILLESCKYLHEIKGDIVTQVVDFLLIQHDIAEKKYGLNAIIYFRDFALSFMKIIASKVNANTMNDDSKSDHVMLEVAKTISKNCDGTNEKLLALHLLPKNKSKDKKFMQVRKEVLDRILKNCDMSVEIFLASVYYTENV